MSRPAIEVADIVRAQGRQFLERFQASFSYQALKAFRPSSAAAPQLSADIRTSVSSAGHEAPISYNSCRTRCCPKCQAQARAALARSAATRTAHHQLFPRRLHRAPRSEPAGAHTSRRFFDLLFDASSQTLLEVAADPKRLCAEIGFLAILHTWSPEPAAPLPCPLRRSRRRSVARSSALDPVPATRCSCCPCRSCSPCSAASSSYCLGSAIGKGLFDVEASPPTSSDPSMFDELAAELSNKKWVVYAKPPFGGPRSAPYLARYTHRIAISNRRLLSIDDENVTFRWQRLCPRQLAAPHDARRVEFLRRFLLHVVPSGFVRRKLSSFGMAASRSSISIRGHTLSISAVLKGPTRVLW